jgi:hypothetical protein
MVHEYIDIERCVWDLDYRRRIKQLLNTGVDVVAANQNSQPGETDGLSGTVVRH